MSEVEIPTAPTAEKKAIAELERRLEAARMGGGPERIARQHKAGKLAARERIELLLDTGSRAAWSTSSPRTSPSSEGRCRRPTRARSAR